MDAAAWLAEFARREQVWRDERQAFMDRVGALATAKHESHSSDVGKPVVLETREADEDDLPTAAKRVAARAAATGWSTRTVASLAAVPASGLVTVVTVRCRRHDERCWAAWHNGRFDVAWYGGPTGLERLGMVKSKVRRRIVDVIEGVRGPKQWIDLLERQEMDRAVQVLRDASLGPMIGT